MAAASTSPRLSPSWHERRFRRLVDAEVIALDHDRFRYVWTGIFTRRLVADCMTHRCTMVDTHAKKLDACCQYGCDVDIAERAAILERASDIRPLLRADVAGRP